MSDTTTLNQAAASARDETAETEPTPVVTPEESADLPKARLDELPASDGRPPGKDIGLELILDVPVTVTLELGRTTLTVRDLLQLNQGSVVEFDRRVGEPLDLLVNGTLLAHGELVVIDDGFGIRLTEVMSPRQRLEKLN